MGLLFVFAGVYAYHYLPNTPAYTEQHQTILLSYVPSIEIFSTQQQMFPISLKKLNVFENNEFAALEEVEPVLDSVLYIPKPYRAGGLA